MATGMESLKETVAAMLKDSLKEALDPITKQMVTKLRKKLNDLEDRSRSNNVRLVNLPAGIEGDDPSGYLQKMLPEWIPTLKRSHSTLLEIDRAHRIYSNNTSRPRTMIFKLLCYTDRQAILAGARKARPALSDGTQLLFFADYSPGTTQERQGYREIRAKLRRKESTRS
ncbi:hypothetical protein AAFF_G00327910 [Aldrovandia affinis]|uniref:Uncharacterized protein n=1 Tax=Aldrovandia affinis TaxID=143900 RepID=A0AAD7TAP2_9TELE|nr:hypothetical protein AAFF_G00327910 [Aldrovandia affinis]